MPKKCSSCGFSDNPDNAHYCGKCGYMDSGEYTTLLGGGYTTLTAMLS